MSSLTASKQKRLAKKAEKERLRAPKDMKKHGKENSVEGKLNRMSLKGNGSDGEDEDEPDEPDLDTLIHGEKKGAEEQLKVNLV